MVPIYPLNSAGTTEESQRKIQEMQKDILMSQIRLEIQKQCQYYYDCKSYREIDELVDMLSHLEICKGLDVYDTNRMLNKAYESLKKQDKSSQKPTDVPQPGDGQF